MAVELKQPTREQLQDAVAAAKKLGLQSTSIKTTDHGSGVVRAHLPDEFINYPLDQLRIDCTNLSRGGHEPGKRKRTQEQKQECALTRLVKAFPSAASHSEEYRELHESDEWKLLVSQLRKIMDYRCQLCVRAFHANELEGHIIDYMEWRKPGFVLLLCSKCHPIADALRRMGKVCQPEVFDLFSQPIR